MMDLESRTKIDSPPSFHNADADVLLLPMTLEKAEISIDFTESISAEKSGATMERYTIARLDWRKTAGGKYRPIEAVTIEDADFGALFEQRDRLRDTIRINRVGIIVELQYILSSGNPESLSATGALSDIMFFPYESRCGPDFVENWFE